MTTSKHAIKDYLERDLDSFRWIKDASKRDLRLKIEELGYNFETKPYKHQMACFIIGALRRNFLFLLDMGLGKSKLVCDVLSYRIKQQQIKKRVLIVTPAAVNCADFEEQIHQHTPDHSTISLLGSSVERRELLEEPCDFNLIPYAGLVRLLTVKEAGKGKKKGRLVPSDSEINKFCKMFDAVVYDEVQLAKNRESLTFRICNKLSNKCTFRYGLTGTPFGRDPIDLWAEFYLMDRGETLGKNIGMFREGFFNEKAGRWAMEYNFDIQKYRLLYKFLGNRSIRYSEDECLDLPESIRKVLRFGLSEEARVYYNNTIKELRHAGRDFQLIDNAFIRMRQTASGFIGMKSEDGTEKVEIAFDSNPKMEALKEIVKELRIDRKMVIFYEFTFSGDMICDLLNELEIKHCRLYSKTKDKIGERKKFLTDPEYRIFVVNSKSGSLGLNLQSAANYTVYYESPVSPIVRKQSEKRTRRSGQTRKTFFYDLVAKGSVEERILVYLREGRDMFKAICEGDIPNEL